MEENDNKLVCPKCGKEIPYFITTKQSRYAKCPVCGAQFSRKELEDKYGKPYVRVVPKHVYKMAGRVTLEELLDMINNRSSREEEDEEEEEEREEIKHEIERELRKRDEEYEGRFRASEVFQRPRDPCDILKEVLDMYDFIKEEFKKMMVRRCELMKQLHPLELYHFLKTMRSGVKTDMEAAFIAEDYAMALKAEEEKARSLGYTYVLPNISNLPPVKSSETPIIQRIMEIMKSSSPPRNPSPTIPQTQLQYQSQSQPPTPYSTSVQGQQTPPRPTYTREDLIARIRERLNRPSEPHQPSSNVVIDVGNIVRAVVEANKPSQELVAKLLDKLSSGDRDSKTLELLISLIIENQRMQTEGIKEAIKDALKGMAEQMAKVQEANAKTMELVTQLILKERESKPSVPPEIAQALAEFKAKTEFMEKLMKLQEQQYKNMLQIVLAEKNRKEQEIKSIIEAWQKERQELMARLSMMQAAPSDYKSDEAKILAQALNNLSLAARETFRPLVENLSRREPVKLIVDTLPKVVMMSSGYMPPPEMIEQSQQKKELKKPKKTKTSDEIIAELEKEGLVEE